MSARLRCPECGAVPKPDDDLPPGKKITCRKCGEVYRVPVDDDDDYDDERESRRPRRRRRQEAGSAALIGVLVAVVLVAALAVGAIALAAAFWHKDTAVADRSAKPAPAPVVPPGPPPFANQPPAAGPRVGQPAPEIDGEDIDGKKFKLSDYRGKVVLLDFWGHW
jgi:hypothetical protein